MTVLMTVLLIRSAHETQSLRSPSTPSFALTPKMSLLLPLLLLLACCFFFLDLKINFDSHFWIHMEKTALVASCITSRDNAKLNLLPGKIAVCVRTAAAALPSKLIHL